MPIGIGGIISGAGSLLGGLFGSNAASDAAKAQTKAANQATALSAAEVQAIMEQLRPFLQTGTTANQVLAANYFGINGPGGTFAPNAPFLQPISSTVGGPPNPNDPNLRAGFQASPGYQYQLGQQQNAIQNSAAGRTGAISGNMLRELQQNAQGLAGQDWWQNYNAMVGNYGNRYQDIANQRNTIIGGLGTMAGAGQNAAVQGGGFGTSAVNQIGNNLNLAGSAQAAGILGSSNAMSGGINSAIQNLFGGGGGSGSGGSNPLSFLFGNSGQSNFDPFLGMNTTPGQNLGAF